MAARNKMVRSTVRLEICPRDLRKYRNAHCYGDSCMMKTIFWFPQQKNEGAFGGGG